MSDNSSMKSNGIIKNGRRGKSKTNKHKLSLLRRKILKLNSISTDISKQEKLCAKLCVSLQLPNSIPKQLTEDV